MCQSGNLCIFVLDKKKAGLVVDRLPNCDISVISRNAYKSSEAAHSMTPAPVQHKSSVIQPIRSFPRLDALLLMFFVEEKLSSIQASMTFEILIGMDTDNIFECEVPVVEFFQERFDISKNHAYKHLKHLRDLQIYLPLNAKALRFNPYIANRVKNLSGLWEFEGIEIACSAEYLSWLTHKGIPQNLPSYVRVKKAQRKSEWFKENYISKREHAEIVDRHVRQINELIDEHTKDTETFLAQRELDDVRALAKIDSLERVINEQSAELRNASLQMHEQSLILKTLQGAIERLLATAEVPHSVKAEVKRHLSVVGHGFGQEG